MRHTDQRIRFFVVLMRRFIGNYVIGKKKVTGSLKIRSMIVYIYGQVNYINIICSYSLSNGRQHTHEI